jgi:hypothetical protein
MALSPLTASVLPLFRNSFLRMSKSVPEVAKICELSGVKAGTLFRLVD